MLSHAATALLGLAEGVDHFQVAFGLVTEARQMPELKAARAQLREDWLSKLAEMIGELQGRGVVRSAHDPYALALLWSSVTTGLAAHRLADPGTDLEPALALAKLSCRLPFLNDRADRRGSSRSR